MSPEIIESTLVKMGLATGAALECGETSRVGEVRGFMERLLKRYSRPALLVSFGKDSMAMLHLLADYGFPVVVLKPAHVPASKWAFAFKMIQEYGLKVHFIPAEAVALKLCEGVPPHIVTSYQTGGGNPVVWEQGTVQTEHGLCAVEDILPQPSGRVRADWDVLLCAQKEGDPDFAGGTLSRPFDLLQNPGGADLAFPLRTWTDHDVWDYTAENSVPYDEARYDPINPNDTYESNDWVRCCTKCCDPREPATVFCPRLKLHISNRSAQTPFIQTP